LAVHEHQSARKRSVVAIGGNHVDDESTWERDQSQLNSSDNTLGYQEVVSGSGDVTEQGTDGRIGSLGNDKLGGTGGVCELGTEVVDGDRGVDQDLIGGVIDGGDDQGSWLRLQQDGDFGLLVSDHDVASGGVREVVQSRCSAREESWGDGAEENGGIDVGKSGQDGDLHALALNCSIGDIDQGDVFENSDEKRSRKFSNDEVDGGVSSSDDHSNFGIGGVVGQRSSARYRLGVEVLNRVKSSGTGGDNWKRGVTSTGTGDGGAWNAN